jgi:FdhE protein
MQRLLSRLARIASEGEGATSLGAYVPAADEALRLLGAAVRHDGAEIAEVAAAQNVDAGALTSIIHLALLPVLRPWSRAHAERVPRYWPHGYCPVCAAWPIFAERRGLDRSRRLRCGRCAAGWEVEWLYCVYCKEREHQRLGALEPDGQGEILKVETCATCGAYLKSLASLQGFSDFELLLQDLETVELDLIALDRGYRRPSQSGFTLDTRLSNRASGQRL